MKKLIFILLLFAAFTAKAQLPSYPGYTNINAGYQWLRGMFQALGAPAGGNPAFATGQLPRAGALYYDSTGTDSGFYYYSGTIWKQFGATPPIPTLQEVLDAGNTSSGTAIFMSNANVIFQYNATFPAFQNGITLSSGTSAFNSLSNYIHGSPLYDSAFRFTPGNSNSSAVDFDGRLLTDYRRYTLPDQSGTLAMVGDITTNYFGLPLYLDGDTVKIDAASSIQDGYATAAQIAKLDTLRNDWSRNVSRLHTANTTDSVFIGATSPVTPHVFNLSGNMYFHGKMYYTTANRRLFDALTGQNLFVGGRSGNETYTGLENTGIGELSLGSLTSNNYNTAVGKGSGFAITTGTGNNIFGRNAFATGTVTGSYNVINAYNGDAPVSRDSSDQVNIGNVLFGHKGRFYLGGVNTPTAITPSSTRNPTAVIDVDTISGPRYSPLRLREMTADPAVINDGNIWHYNDHLYARLNGANYQLDQQTAATPGIDDVLAVGQSLSTNRTLNVGANTLSVGGSATAFSLLGTGSGPVGFAQIQPASTNTMLPVYTFRRSTTGTAASGIGGRLDLELLNGSGSAITANSIKWRLTTVTAGAEVSEFIVNGLGAGADRNFLTVQTDGTTTVNNGVDSLATKAYARSLISGGTPALTQYRLAVGDASNLLSTGAAITGSRALISDANGVPTHSTVTSTELALLSGKTSIQQKPTGTYSTRTGLTPADGDDFFQTDAQRDAPPGRYYYINSKWNYVPIAPERLLYQFDDFPAVGTANTTLGSYVLTATGSAAGIANGVRLSTAASSTGRVVLYSGSNGVFGGWVDMDLGSAYMKVNLNLAQLSTVSEEFILRVGFSDMTAGTEPNNGVYIEYDRLSSVNWRYTQAAGAGTRTETASSTAVATGANVLEIFCPGAGGTSEFWINGTSIGSTSATMPTALLSPFIQWVKSAGTNPVTVDLDYSKVWHYLTTQRN